MGLEAIRTGRQYSPLELLLLVPRKKLNEYSVSLTNDRAACLDHYSPQYAILSHPRLCETKISTQTKSKRKHVALSLIKPNKDETLTSSQ